MPDYIEERRNRFEFIMKNKNHSFKSLAETVGVNEKTLRNFKNGGNISINTLIDVSLELGVSIDYLVGASNLDYDRSYFLNEMQKQGRICYEAIQLLDKKQKAINSISNLISDSNKTDDDNAYLEDLISRYNDIFKN
ncbi:helix-turn-helix domain-containing protein [Mammaliicoccus sciuri]|uniref:helix-turn-helix domain-containing protein n=1 Tax=Mammaliicoccus sciuri TaxID=1296 RepID=UPI000D1DEC08|nr:helix-turn-helix transcriptional regulator [Mammaliicoccus sciuri]PTJ54227.1 hypothetical protein BU012_01120 [Mammaliicoccus sciuri]